MEPFLTEIRTECLRRNVTDADARLYSAMTTQTFDQRAHTVYELKHSPYCFCYNRSNSVPDEFSGGVVT